jgi:hypothetical protein
MKLAAVLALGIGIVIAAQAFLHVHRISALQEREIRDDLRILARTVAAATGEIWAIEGEAHARRFLARADAERRYTSIELTPDTDADTSTRAPGDVAIRRLEHDKT